MDDFKQKNNRLIYIAVLKIDCGKVEQNQEDQVKGYGNDPGMRQ